MKLLTTCVNFSDYLAKALPTWLVPGIEVIVVTSPGDHETTRLCDNLSTRSFITGAFHSNGSSFAKSRAMLAAVEATSWLMCDDWLCFIDADICLPYGWFDTVLGMEPEPGKLYGVRRMRENGEMIHGFGIIGYFQMFHSSDKNATMPLFPASYDHASGYDMKFQRRWRRGQRVMMPIVATHLGEPFKHHFGRGNPMRYMRKPPV